jgi:glycosyltransferase involved in cell wall biosynthesis
MAEWSPQSMSIVIPVFDEERNVGPLVRELVSVLRPLGVPFEIVMVDDASGDGTLAALRDLIPSTPELVVIALRRNFGQTLDPRDIPRLVAELSRGAHAVSGWRRERKDAILQRRLPSWIANWLIQRLLGVPLHDQGCALKAYRRDVVRSLDLYADMHRFIGLMTLPLGASLTEIEVHHRPRLAGSSSYGPSRAFKVLVDLFTIKMLAQFQDRPARWFAILGSPFLFTGVLALLTPLITGSGLVVPGTIALISATTFGFCLLLGVLGEAAIELARGGARRVVLFRERADP